MKMSDRNKLMISLSKELYGMVTEHITWIEQQHDIEFKQHEVRDLMKAVMYEMGVK